MENEENTPASAIFVAPLVKAGIRPHASRPDLLCVTITAAVTGVHHFSANAADWAQFAGALLRMAEPARAAPVPPAAIEPDELEGAAEYAARVVADWAVTGGTLGALAMATTALIARQVEAESGRAAAVQLFAGLAELVRTAPPLDDGDGDGDGDSERRH